MSSDVENQHDRGQHQQASGTLPGQESLPPDQEPEVIIDVLENDSILQNDVLHIHRSQQFGHARHNPVQTSATQFNVHALFPSYAAGISTRDIQLNLDNPDIVSQNRGFTSEDSMPPPADLSEHINSNSKLPSPQKRINMKNIKDEQEFKIDTDHLRAVIVSKPTWNLRPSPSGLIQQLGIDVGEAPSGIISSVFHSGYLSRQDVVA